jgi:ribosome recycling factor
MNMADLNNKEPFEKVMERLHTELSSIRTGRANPALLSTVMVESYGTRVPLQQVASVSVTDAKTLTVSPWDKGQLQAVEKGIVDANLGLTPNNDGAVIRVNLPLMSEDRRKEMAKLVGQIAEQARIGVRQAREEILKAVKREEGEGNATKDDLADAQKKIQTVVDDYNKKIKDITDDKEKEIMTV